jgi:hypothetical protein
MIGTPCPKCETATFEKSLARSHATLDDPIEVWNECPNCGWTNRKP